MSSASAYAVHTFTIGCPKTLDTQQSEIPRRSISTKIIIEPAKNLAL